MVASAVQSLHLKKSACWLAVVLVVDEIFIRLVSNNFLHIPLLNKGISKGIKVKK